MPGLTGIGNIARVSTKDFCRFEIKAYI